MALTTKAQTFVDAFCEALDADVAEAEAYRTAKMFAGYSENTSRNDILSDEVVQAIQNFYNQKMVFRLSKASKAVDSLLDTPDQDGAAVLLATANSVLDRGGVIKKESKEITVKAATGIVALPAKAELDKE